MQYAGNRIFAGRQMNQSMSNCFEKHKEEGAEWFRAADRMDEPMRAGSIRESRFSNCTAEYACDSDERLFCAERMTVTISPSESKFPVNYMEML